MVCLKLLNYARNYVNIKKTLDSPRQLIFFVSDRCNGKCGHCFWANKKAGRELSLKEIENFAADLKNPLSLLVITGGEPFFRNDIKEICDIFTAKNSTKSFQICTNGSMADKVCDFAEKMKGCNFSVQISIDGTKEVHDKIRGHGMFDKAMETIKRLKKMSVPVQVNTVVSNMNRHEMRAISELMKGLGVSHNFDLIRMDHNPQDPSFKAPYDLDDVCKEIIELSPHNSMSRGSIECKAKILKGGKKIMRCLAGNVIGVVYSNGDIALCEMTKPVGNIKDGFMNAWKSAEAEKRREEIKDCFCTHGCFLIPSMMYNPLLFGKMVLKYGVMKR